MQTGLGCRAGGGGRGMGGDGVVGKWGGEVRVGGVVLGGYGLQVGVGEMCLFLRPYRLQTVDER